MEYLYKVHGGDGARPQGPEHRSSFAGSPLRLSGDGPLRPAEADLVKVRIGMSGADVVKDPRDGAANAVVEALGGIGMSLPADILALGMPDRVMGGKGGADRHEDFPLVAHEMSPGINGG